MIQPELEPIDHVCSSYIIKSFDICGREDDLSSYWNALSFLKYEKYVELWVWYIV